MSKFEEYLNTYSGRELLKKYSLDADGLWQIFGEDPNCDMGGSHHSPSLGFASGKLADVIEYGVALPRFWQWGAGGDFKLIKGIVNVNPEENARRRQLEEKEAELKAQLEEVQRQLGR